MKETNNEEQLGIFIEGYLSARFDMLIDDELNAHLALVSEVAPSSRTKPSTALFLS